MPVDVGLSFKPPPHSAYLTGAALNNGCALSVNYGLCLVEHLRQCPCRWKMGMEREMAMAANGRLVGGGLVPLWLPNSATLG